MLPRTLTLFAIIIIGIGAITALSVREEPATRIEPGKIEPIATQSGRLATYVSPTFHLSFQYPEGWLVEDTPAGITVTSFRSDTGYIGKVPQGGFQIDLSAPKASPQPLIAWCMAPLEQDKFSKAMNLSIATSTHTFARSGHVVAFDYTSRRDPTYNARSVCIQVNEEYVAIDAYPLTAHQMPLLDVVVNTIRKTQ